MSKLRISNQDISTSEVFQVVCDDFPDIIHSIDSDGKIVFTNRRAEELLGYTRDELIGRNVREIYTDEVPAARNEGSSDPNESGETRVESILKDKQGNRIPVEIRSFSIYDDNGDVIRTFSILRDIRQIKALQNDIVRSERLAAIGELASGVVHDINNPLSVISFALELIGPLMRGEKDLSPEAWEEVTQFIADVQKASDNIASLVTHLRNFSRQPDEKMELTDLYFPVADAIFLLKRKLKLGRVDIQNKLKPDQHFVIGDTGHLQHIFANLFSNACDAMSDGQTRILSISIERFKKGETDFWRCSVADTGAGMSEETKNQLFKSFFTTKPVGKGTGLGLSIVDRLVTAHGGFVEAESELGKGSTFSIFFPVAN
ncbi:MAG: PAS domain S-box protein [Verrucomicrobia bacterium]|nr:PAS domain S-box protein [Verrucomicrobiota bacterium]